MDKNDYMNAVVWLEPLKVAVKRVAKPKILSSGDVLVKVILSGLCGSDLHPFRGHEPGLLSGTCQGHEMVGKVVEIGSEVKSFRLGDRVTCPFTISCGKCWACKIVPESRLNYDELRLTCRCTESRLFGWVGEGDLRNPPGLQGCQAEFVRVPLADSTLVKLPVNVSDETGLMLGDILPTGVFACLQGGLSLDKDNSNKTVVVLGAGPVGLIASAMAKQLFKATTVITIDGVEERLEMAKDFSKVDFTVSLEDTVEKVSNHLLQKNPKGPGLADVVIECVGSTPALSLGYKLVRPGGILSVVGAHNASGEGSFGFSPVDHYDKNLTVRIGRSPARALIDPILAIIDEIPSLSPLITHKLPLSEAVKGYDMFNNKLEGCIKIVFTPE